LKDLGFDKNDYIAQHELALSISKHIFNLKKNVDAMIEARKKCNAIEESSEKAKAYCEQVLPFFEEIRYHADKLEQFVDNSIWTLPKYRELLYIR
jgi:glutamine synthetase